MKRKSAHLVALKEPTTMSGAQGLVETVYPGKPSNVYLDARQGIRYVTVSFGRNADGVEERIEGMGNTWLTALADVEIIRTELRRKARKTKNEK